MSSPKLLTASTAPLKRRRKKSEKKKPFDLRAKAALRKLLAALREIGDRPDVDELLQRYDVTAAQLTRFIKATEAEAVLVEGSLSLRAC
jgi:hypothetical protein